MASPIGPFYNDALRALNLLGARDASTEAYVRATLAKALVLVAVSHFEVALTQGIDDAFRARLGEGALARFVRRKAIEMQFHSLFDWTSRNANKFLGYFGDGFRNSVREALEQRGDGRADAAFVEIGALRNRLAHSGFATYPVDKTLEELYELSTRAELFLDVVLSELAHLGAPQGHPTP